MVLSRRLAGVGKGAGTYRQTLDSGNHPLTHGPSLGWRQQQTRVLSSQDLDLDLEITTAALLGIPEANPAKADALGKTGLRLAIDHWEREWAEPARA